MIALIAILSDRNAFVNINLFHHLRVVHNKSVLREDGKIFYISSGFPDIHHIVDVTVPCCSCSSFCISKMPCRHIFFLMETGKFSWDELPQQYTSLPFFNKDNGGNEKAWQIILVDYNMSFFNLHSHL